MKGIERDYFQQQPKESMAVLIILHSCLFGVIWSESKEFHWFLTAQADKITEVIQNVERRSASSRHVITNLARHTFIPGRETRFLFTIPVGTWISTARHSLSQWRWTWPLTEIQMYNIFWKIYPVDTSKFHTLKLPHDRGSTYGEAKLMLHR